MSPKSWRCTTRSWRKLRTVYDPEIPVNIYDLGLIYDVKVEPTGDVYVKMTLDLARLSCRRHASRRGGGQDCGDPGGKERQSGCSVGTDLG